MNEDAVSQAVLGPLTSSAIFLVLTIQQGGETAVRELLGEVAGFERSVGFRVPEAGLGCVVGIGSAAWDRLFSGARPRHLHELPEIVGGRHHAVSTPGDLLLHIRAAQLDVCFELATLVVRRLGGAANVVDEVHGFRYFDERDLLGFVDGTENPTGEAIRSVALVGGEDPEFRGGSYVIVQKYLHDLDAWNELSTEDQERVIGRRKLSNVELDDKPANSHVALNRITDADGTERQILRDNMPFGSVGSGEFGTYFIGYARDPGITEQMLRNMFVGNPPGNTDRILQFSRALTGSLFFVPTVDFLEDPPALPGT